MLELSLASAFLVGLLGGGHCAGMCGGIVGAVSLSLPGSRPRIGFLLAYNLGRIASYGAAGLLAGAIGASSFFLDHVLPVERVLYALASVMLILLGLYLAGICRGVVVLETVGGKLWRQVQPWSKRFLPVRTLPQALALGSIWGWLPCGLVYSVGVAALATGSPWRGAALMLAVLQHFWVRRLSGLVVIGFGLLGLWRLAS